MKTIKYKCSGCGKTCYGGEDCEDLHSGCCEFGTLRRVVDPFVNATCGDPGPGNQGLNSRRTREARFEE